MANVISSSLCQAAHQGLYDEVCRLLENGHHVNNADNRGWTPLHEAAAAGHESCVQKLLEQEECNPNYRTHEGWTPLYLACRDQNKQSLVSLLLHNGALCNIGDNEDISPLHLTCHYNRIELACELLDNGADILKQDFNGLTPLHEATAQHNLGMVKLLLDRGACVNLQDILGRTALFSAASEGWVECSQLLIKHGASVNLSTLDGTTPLMVAASSQSVAEVCLLLENGADPNIECRNHQLPLNLAVHTGIPSLVKLLLDKTDKSVIVRNSSWAPDETTSLPGLAIDSGSVECLSLILGACLGPVVDCCPLSVSCGFSLMLSYKKMSPLCFLLQDQLNLPHALQMLQLLLDRGAGVNVSSVDEMPPLVALLQAEPPHDSAKDVVVSFLERKLYCFHKLLEYGCNIDYCTTECKIPDAVLAACLNSYEYNRPLLQLILQNCMACSSDDVFRWIAKCSYQVDIWVIQTLLEFGTASPSRLQSLAKHFLSNVKSPSRNALMSLRKTLELKQISSLQALSRLAVCKWLWSYTSSSLKAKRVMAEMHIPMPIQHYIGGKPLLLHGEFHFGR